MNTYKKPRGNNAKRDKDSILADTKNLLYILYGCIQRMPKIERIEGAPVEMKRACYDLIRHFTVAIECQEVRLVNIHQMFGEFGTLLASFDLCIQFGLFTDSEKLRIATQLERIEEGIRKWRNATRSLRSQERQEVADTTPEESAVSNE
jgi:hypothetical protein